MAEERPFAVHRILVAIDASAASLDALAAAASLAARLGSELSGLFVEDEDLLRLAGLPFGDVFPTTGGGRERLDRTSAEAALRALASRAREALERTASSHQVACSFRVTRGRVVREVLAAAEAADLVVLGATGHGRSAPGAVGQTARAAAGRARAPVLLLSRGSRLAGGAVVAVDDGTPSGTRAVAAARRLSQADRPPAIVCTPDGRAPAIVDAIARLAAALVVLPAEAAAPPPGGVLDRLLAAGVAVLVVR
jgi:nucleotide-binding universal stress UspA family protein